MSPRRVGSAMAAVVLCVSTAYGQAVTVSPAAPLMPPDEPALSVAAGAGFGTLGWGLAVAAGSPYHWQLRGVYNRGDLTVDATQNGIDYDVDLSLETAGLIVDFYPGGSYFRLSAGWLLNGNDFDGEARPSEPETIGNRVYTPEEIGTLRARVDVGDTAPYLGIGFGNPLDVEGRLKIVADIGVLIHERVDLELDADGLLAGNPAFRADLEKERQDIEDDIINRLRFYPVVSIGITFRF